MELTCRHVEVRTGASFKSRSLWFSLWRDLIGHISFHGEV